MSKSIWVKVAPKELPLKPEAKYTVACPKCVDSRHKRDTKSLQVYRDKDGIVRWECYHPGCEYNVRHAAVDPQKDNIDYEANKIEHALPMTLDPTKEDILKPLIKQADMMHWYRNIDGEYLFGIRRFKDKTMTPIAMLKNGDFSIAEYPKVKALYNAHKLKLRPEASVIVVEGEKAVDLGEAKFPNSVVVTWPGGCNGTDRGDWSLLKGRNVLIWPDQDDAGKKAAEKIAEKLDANVSIAYVNHLPESADIADDIPQEDLDKAVEARIEQNPAVEITNTMSSADLKYALSNSVKGIPTGWDIVDQSILLRGLSVIEGRSSHGKSTVMFNLANNIMQRGEKVVFYSYEMSGEEVLLRMALLNEDRALDSIPWKSEEKLAKLVVEGKSKGYDVVDKYLNKSFYVTDENLNIDRLIEEISQPALRGAVIFIDYIQFIPATGGSHKPRYLQIKEFAERMKAVAKKQKLTIITGAQLTAGDQPAQDVAREGKDIYNAADVVLRVWNREEGNQTETKWSKKDDGDSDALLLVRKARAGANLRSFDFNFTDTRKMEFNVDKQLRIFLDEDLI